MSAWTQLQKLIVFVSKQFFLGVIGPVLLSSRQTNHAPSHVQISIPKYSFLTNTHYFRINSTIKKKVFNMKMNIPLEILLIWAAFLCKVEVLPDSCVVPQQVVSFTGGFN